MNADLENQTEGKRYRSTSDIEFAILDCAIEEGQSRTRIMYQAFLSYTQLKSYLSEMIGRGLLELNKNGDGTVYVVTDKGRQYHKQLADLLKLRNGTVKRD